MVAQVVPTPSRNERVDNFLLAGYSRDRLRYHFEGVARRAVERILKLYDKVVAIGVDGSVGRRSPSPYSDIDIFVLVRGKRLPDPMYYLDMGCYVAIGFSPLRERKERGVDFFYARGGARSARVLYDPRGILKRRIEKRRTAKPASHTVEEALFDAYTNIIEYAGKLRNGWVTSNEYLTRYAARTIASRSEEVVMALNDLSPVSENIVWNLVMKAKKKPAHFTLDYPIARGHQGTAQTRRVFKSGLRLARESLKLVKDEYAEKARGKSFRSLLGEPLDQIGL